MKKRRKKKQRQKENTWKEFLYNCPYLIAITVTSLGVMICSDQIGFRAVARETGEVVVQTLARGAGTQEAPVDLVADEARENVVEMEKQDNNIEDNGENAGKRKENNDEKEYKTEHENNLEEFGNADNWENEPIGITKFEFYEPQETDSIYYSDAGKVALTTEYPYARKNDSYFDDAVFLGDSRTLGISDYAGLDNADFYCDSGMTIFKLLEEKVTYQKTGDKEDLPQVLTQKQYGKIYIMLGMNELGYGNTNTYLEQYRKVVEQIRVWQPDAIIYIMANLHVSREKNNIETEFNNININDKNAASASLANGTDVFYLDVNPLFTDAEGYLNAELSFDGVHLYAQHYDVWRQFLLEHAVEAAKKPGADKAVVLPGETLSDEKGESVATSDESAVNDEGSERDNEEG